MKMKTVVIPAFLWACAAVATVSTESAARPSTAVLVQQMEEMNYYPAQNSWEKMWLNWDAGVIDADMARIAALHANTVRIVIQANTFGYPTPSSVMLGYLSQFVTIASNHGLQAHFTLFDGWGSYTDIAGSKAWANAVVSPFAGDPRVSVIEIQNEINPGDASQMTWANALIPYVRSISGGIPVTVSVYSGFPTLVQALASNPPDLWNIHYYYGGGYDNIYSHLSLVKQAAGSTPVMFGETGVSTPPGDEAGQDCYFRDAFLAARAVGIGDPAPWILYDFPLDSSAWYLTWTKANGDLSQFYYGIFHVDGTPKPAAGTIAALFQKGIAFSCYSSLPNAAQFISQNVPSAMTAGQSYPISVTLKNMGTAAWDSTLAANPYHLGSQNPADNSTWGTGRVSLPSTVAPGAQVTIPFTVRAPAAAGTYNFQWQMVQESVAWFGDLTLNVAVNVSSALPNATPPGAPRGVKCN